MQGYAEEQKISNPTSLTSYVDQKTITAVRKAIVLKTKESEEAGTLEDEGKYEALTADEFTQILINQAKIPRDVAEIITKHIDVNDDGDIEFDEFINFILAAESNLEFSKKSATEKFIPYDSTKGNSNSGSGRGKDKNNVDKLLPNAGANSEYFTCITQSSRPVGSIICGSSNGVIHMFDQVTLKPIDRFVYVSKLQQNTKKIFQNVRSEDKARLIARFKGEGLADGIQDSNSYDENVKITTISSLNGSPQIIMIGSFDYSISFYDVSTQVSRLSPLGQISSLLEYPTNIISFIEKRISYGSSHDENDMDMGMDVMDTDTDTIIADGSISADETTNCRLGTATTKGNEEGIEEGKEPQVIYFSTSDGRIYWMKLDYVFGKPNNTYSKNVIYMKKALLAATKENEIRIKYEEQTVSSSPVGAGVGVGSSQSHSRRTGHVPSKPNVGTGSGTRGGGRTPRGMKQTAKSSAKVIATSKSASASATSQLELELEASEVKLPNVKLHSDTITKMIYIAEYDYIATSSLDGTYQHTSIPVYQHTSVS